MNFNGSKFYRATNRTFGFSPADGGLLAAIRQIALQCWDMVDLKNNARVDRSIDKDKNTLVLEINANPCIAPDSGFFAAAKQFGMSYTGMVEMILAAAKR